ncbi:MAG: hypothetical protein M3P18_00665 [Actinomycetota bacterium]|nr:hypothetical protein [Actinomycetota bacterium]
MESLVVGGQHARLAAEAGRGAEQLAAYGRGGDIAGWHIAPDEDDAPAMNAVPEEPGVTTKHAPGLVPWERDTGGEMTIYGRDADALDVRYA